MKVLITGGRGFIGHHLARRLMDDGHKVVTLDTKPCGLSGTVNDTFIDLEGSVVDPKMVRQAYAQNVSHVVHMASRAGVPNIMENPTSTMDISILGTWNMVKNAPKNLESFVYLSTSEVQGIHAFQVAESSHNTIGPPGEARWTYAVSKLACEHYLMSSYKENKLPATVLRPFNVFGPGQVGFGAMHEFVVNGLRGDQINVFHNGTQIRSWCYVSDMVDAIVKCLIKKEAHGKILNIGNPANTVSVYQLAKMIKVATGNKSSIFKHPRVFHDVEIRCPNIEQARDIIGFDPKVELDEGISETVEWYRE